MQGLSVTDPKAKGVGLGTPAPSRSKFFYFHVVFDKNLPNMRLAPPYGLVPPSGKSWIRHSLLYNVFLDARNSAGSSRCKLSFLGISKA